MNTGQEKFNVKDLRQILCYTKNRYVCAWCRSVKKTYNPNHECPSGDGLIIDSFLSVYNNNDEYYGKRLALFKEESIDK